MDWLTNVRLRFGFPFDDSQVLEWGWDEARVAAFHDPHVEENRHYRQYTWRKPAFDGLLQSVYCRFWKSEHMDRELRELTSVLEIGYAGDEGYARFDLDRFMPGLQALLGPGDSGGEGDHSWEVGPVTAILYESEPGEFSSEPFKLNLHLRVDLDEVARLKALASDG